ncbi:MAG: hypothetical protein CM1200mP30_11750 [Pseudomonadota bacterium]|nr:MAG: hypothetical protein CM1200mP30_11750 [Pseudomonadota bacterium]
MLLLLLLPLNGNTNERYSPVVEASKVDLVFQTADGPVHALSDIDLEINKGDFISLIGPSGCGKTTLLRLIADLEKPTGGMLKVNGISPGRSPPES